MKSRPRDQPFSFAPGDVARVRQVFDAAGFDEKSIAETCGVKSIAGLKDVPAELVFTRTASGSALHTFVRLFVLGVPCRNDDVRRAVAPMHVERWVQGGLLLPEG